VGGLDLIQLSFSCLMNELHAVLPIAQIGDCVDNGTVNRLGALAAAKDQNGVWSRMRLRRNRLELGTNGISGNDCLLSEVGLRSRVGDCREIDPLAKHAIRESRNRILLHDQSGIAAKDCRAQDGEGCVSADADDDIRFELPKDISGFENATHHAHQIADLTSNANALDSAYRQCSQLESFLRDDARFNSLFSSYKQNFRSRHAALYLTSDSNPWK